MAHIEVHHDHSTMTIEQATAELAAADAKAVAIIPGPCPEWCERPVGHKYVVISRDEGLSRFHEQLISTHVSVEAEERLSVDGVVSLAYADVWLTGLGDASLPPAEAYGLIDALTTATNQCQSIRAAQS
jgi:hypothetical protein